MAVSFDAVSGAEGPGSSTTLSWSHTVASGGILVVFAASLSSAETVTGVTFDGVALTQLLAETENNGVGAANSAWVMHNPPTGSAKTVEITVSATSGGYIAGHAVSYTGVANGSAAATHRTIYNGGAHGGGGDVTVVDSASGDLVLSSCSNFNASANLTAVHTSRRIDLAIQSSTYQLGTQDQSASGGNTVMSWTNDDFCTNIAFALIPSGSPAVDTTAKIIFEHA